MRLRSRAVAVLAAIAVACCAAPARGVISITAGPDGQGVVINTLLGADRFYNNGYFGQNSVVANVEAGAIWNGHETLTQVNTYIADPSITGTQLGQFDYHATAVGMTIGGQGQFYYYQAGIAPLVNLWSGSIATKFNGDGSFETTDPSFIYAYKQAMQVGRDVTYDIGGGITYTLHRTADVVNSSWGFEEPTGTAFEAIAIDALAAANGVTFVAAAGNSGPGTNTVIAPASGYNKIAVAALAADNTANPYTVATSFSSRGPNDFYNPQTKVTTPGVRPVVDIAAPGEDLALAYYGGTTGTNSGGTDTTGGANNYYLTAASGTSFAAPIVAGGAALLDDYAHVNFGPHGTDPRVIKAVLLNSADKTPGWDNGQHLNSNGVIVTMQALDYTTGAGRMNLDRAYDQFTSGTTDTPTLTGGHVKSIGWAMGHVDQANPTDYTIDDALTAGETFTATLAWYVHCTFTDATDTSDATTTDDRFDNLALQIWKLVDGLPTTEVAESDTIYDNVQHLSFAIPDDGQYLVRVRWNGQQYDLLNEPAGVQLGEDYAIAWSANAVPEPAAVGACVVLLSLPLVGRRACRKARLI